VNDTDPLSLLLIVTFIRSWLFDFKHVWTYVRLLIAIFIEIYYVVKMLCKLHTFKKCGVEARHLDLQNLSF